jgi:hypothetical protein
MDKPELQNNDQSTDKVEELAGEGISEILSEAEIEVQPEERALLSKEVVERFSPLMLQAATGPTSQVSVTMSPMGGVQSAHSTKLRNVNLKRAATALPASVSAFAHLYHQHGITDHPIAASALAFLFPLLKPIAESLRIPLTQQAAAVLMVMWKSKKEDEESVAHEGLLTSVNLTFEEYRWKQITGDDLISYLETLEKLRCIEREGSLDSIDVKKIRWRLKEAVKISY